MKVTRNAGYLKSGKITCSMGNHKLSRDVLIFNLPSVVTCPNCDQCKKGCYASKAETLYPFVWKSRCRNLEASFQADFVPRMVTIINRAKPRYVRIHESGDFYSQEYADKWSEIAEALPHVRFYCYTKSPYRPAGKNINIVESFLPDGQVNFGPLPWVVEQAKRFKIKVCPYRGKKTKGNWKCGHECKLCMKAKHVLFVAH